MRSFHVSILALLVPSFIGCGDNVSETTPDASSLDVDAALVDIDAAIEPGIASRVWVISDLLDDRFVAGSFVESNVAVPRFPFTAAVRPPVLVPAAGRLPDSPYVINFSVSRNRIAYTADSLRAGVYDLFAADIDGANPVRLAPSNVLGRSFTAIAISPDGSKVAFLVDADEIRQFDLYIVASDGTGAPIRVSPARPATAPQPDALDVNSNFVWSHDSRYLAFTGDLTEDTVQQAYVVDTTATTPVAVELITRADISEPATRRGVQGLLQFDAQHHVYFRARLDADTGLYRSTPTGQRTRLVLPARGDASASEAGAFTLSNDQLTLFVSADAPVAGRFDLHALPLNGGPSVNLTKATTFDVSIEPNTPIALSRDGTRVAVAANYFSPLNQEPIVIHTDGTGMRRLVDVNATCTTCKTPDVRQLAWTADSTAVYVVGDIVELRAGIYRLDAATTDQRPTQVVVPTANGIVRGVLIQPL